jgi:hypothetical protein
MSRSTVRWYFLAPILASSLSIASAQSAARPPSPAEVAKTKATIQDWSSSIRLSPPKSTRDFRQRYAKALAQIKPADFAFLVLHDQDSKFRADALTQFGAAVSPKEMLPALSRLARNDADWAVRDQAICSIAIAFVDGKLGGREKAVEDLAIERLPDPREQPFCVRILAYSQSPRAKDALREILKGNYDAGEKRLAQQGLNGELKPKSSR